MRLNIPGIVAGICLAMPVAADQVATTDMTLADVSAKLAAPAVLRGKFEQTREIRMLSKPLHSSGSFLLSEHGLYWSQDKPLASVMIADGERLVQSVGDGPLQAIDVAKNPMVLTFSRSFLSIFNGDEAELRANFDVSFEPPGESGRWLISLTPTSYPMSEAIESISLDGREYIENLKVTSRTSETTLISFSELQTEPGELTEHEIELYAR